LNPVELAKRIEERYRRYLKTTFYFKDPELRKSFEEELDSDRLSKGPYLEATPVFKRGRTPKTLFRDLLQSEIDEGFLQAVQGDRPLYRHQENAVQKVFHNENVVVATGTGSGKTEAFLLPILLHLYQEFTAGVLGPGVRALVLYPMNALANDQRDRLGDICKRLKDADSPFRFTFGRYIGETPEDESDTSRHARDHLAKREKDDWSIIENGSVVHGEMVLRKEMREAPPHILLTNYSMLEYLLLRPADSPLFDGDSARWWKFIVLDEAHQYRGTQGAEMAMLLRRLKQRLREGGCTEPLRCIATSATLMGEERDKTAVAGFAENLFGEPFREENVVLGEVEPIPISRRGKLEAEDYDVLRKSLENEEGNVDVLSRMAEKVGVSFYKDATLQEKIGLLLREDSRATALRRLITAEPKPVQEVAECIFPKIPAEDRVPALSGLVDILLRSEDPDTRTPLLSARYHLFLRALEGAFVSYRPWKRVFLKRKKEGTAFEVALCRECGQHYFVAQKNLGAKDAKGIQEAIRDPNDSKFGATFLRPIEERDGLDEEDDDPKDKALFYLCVQCGSVRKARKGKPFCGHDDFILVRKEEPPDDEDRADQLAKCGACGYTASGRDPVREVVHGTDGPHAVIATTLFENLPEGRKKILAFADGRQAAAFFAWYLEDSYQSILNRNFLLNVARKLVPGTKEGVSLRVLAKEMRSLFRGKNEEKRKKAWRALYREFLTDEPRISLEGVGLIRWTIKWPEWISIPEVLKNPPWSLNERQARDLLFILFDTMRADRAVELRSGEKAFLNWSDLELRSHQMRFRISPPRKDKTVRSWDGRQGKRARFLAKLLKRIREGVSDEEAVAKAEETLREIWAWVNKCERDVPRENKLLVPVKDEKRINPDWYRLRLVKDDQTVYQCGVCGRLQTVSVHDVCPRHRCPGRLRPTRVRDLEPNHYRLLYKSDLPGNLRVEEHTAQLEKERAREIQQDFKEGRVHVLSCSTTFELGVDLGDLDTIFLRNVPPESFNYAQRVGRAGRRRSYPGFAVTYCRRSPHDLYHFAEPERMLKGKVRPPLLSLRNEKIITRHITAVALSCFFRDYPKKFKSVGNLFENLENPTGTTCFKEYLRRRKHAIESSLRSVVPSGAFEKVGLSDDSWIERIAGPESRFAIAEAEVSSDYTAVKRLETKAKEEKKDKTAEWAVSRANTISSEDVLSFLSRKAVIPKYGFPVDVVELDTQKTGDHESSQVSLQRDLSIAISEFAPTNKLVANKKMWTSYALKKVPEKEWPRKHYIRSPRFKQWGPGEEGREASLRDIRNPREYVVPIFGFTTSRESKPEEPRSKPRRLLTTRPYFVCTEGTPPGKIELPDERTNLITITKASPGKMVVLCEGKQEKGFYICERCGAGFRKGVNKHKTPLGERCGGTLKRLSLGHEFVTDVLQIQFNLGPEHREDENDGLWFSHSLAYALVEGSAEVLEVPSTDLSATVAYSQNRAIFPIILYDDVPGGAGLVARLEDTRMLKDCLEAALKRVGDKCGCDPDTSCYGCLRTYRNQFAHRHLKRGPVKEYLEMLLRKWDEGASDPLN